MSLPRRLAWFARYPLALALCLQASLLLYRPGLLPLWGDEVGTLRISSMPLSRIPAALQREFHPPLYYFLVHFWTMVPWPRGPLEWTRILSALLALITTVLIDRLWLRELEPRTRLWWLALWTLSPCLILYGRMARPYTLQLLLASLAIHAAVRFLDAPQDRRRMFAYVAAASALLYTHYAPGIAVAAGAGLVFLWRVLRRRSFRALWPPAVAYLLIAALYLPWMARMVSSAARTTHVHWSVRALNPLVEHPVKLAYWFVSFSFGESLPLWVVALGACLGPALVWLAWRGLRPPPAWLAVVLPAAAIGYYGVSQWMSFVFVPARLLFLLPFYYLFIVRGASVARRAGVLVLCGLLAASAGSLRSYFQQDNFLNKAYVIPNEEIADLIRRNTGPAGGLVVVDGRNTNPFPILARLGSGFPVVFVRRDEERDALSREVARAEDKTVWYIRSTHDISLDGIARKLDDGLAPGREARRYLFLKYSAIDRLMMRLLGWPERPTHMLQVLELRPRR